MPEFNINFDPEDADFRFQETDTPVPAGEIVSEGEGDTSYELLRAVVSVVNQERPNGIHPTDVGALIVQFLMQMRVSYTLEETHVLIHQLLAVAENNVRNDDWVNAETMEPANPPILAEEFRSNPDAEDMLEEFEAGLSDDDLTKLLDEEGS